MRCLRMKKMSPLSSLLVENIDKDGGGDHDRTTVHNTGGVDDAHE